MQDNLRKRGTSNSSTVLMLHDMTGEENTLAECKLIDQPPDCSSAQLAGLVCR